MNILQELRISLFKPHLYHKLKGESIFNLLRFDFLVTIIGFIFFIFIKGVKSLIYKNFNLYVEYYRTLSLPEILGVMLYATIGVAIAALFLSAIFFGYNTIKHINTVSFGTIYNYATHTLLISVFLSNLMGPLVIIFTVGFYIMALRGDLMNAQEGVNPMKYLKF